MNLTKTMTVSAVQGMTDQSAAQALLDDQTRRATRADGTAIPIDQYPVVPCYVVVILTDESGSRAEINITEWSEAAGIESGQTIQLTSV